MWTLNFGKKVVDKRLKIDKITTCSIVYNGYKRIVGRGGFVSRISHSGYLEQKAYNEIKEMIINGELKEGDVIIQDQIANRIGVSRTPLRRALKELEYQYLLETTPLGITVRKFSSQFLISVFEVRAVLEGLACRLSTRYIDKATIAYLRTLFETAYEIWRQEGDLEAYRKADITFHTKIMETSQNPILEKNLNNTHVLTIAFSKGLVRSPLETYPEHMVILDALEQGDEQRAEQLMIEHVRKTIPNLASLDSKKAR